MNKFILYIAIAINLCGHIFADDGSFRENIYGNTAYPINNEFIAMVSETVIVDIDFGALYSSKSVNVDAVFNFYNTSDKSVDVLMGFPFNWPHEEGTDNIQSNEELGAAWDTVNIKFLDQLNFKSFVDGKIVNVAKKKVIEPKTDTLKWGLFTWTVNFEPKQKRRLISRYETDLSYGGWSNGEERRSFSYIVSTGALWKDSIGSALIKVNIIGERFLDEELLEFAGITIMPNGFKISNEGNNSAIKWEFKDWEPLDEIKITKNNRSQMSYYMSCVMLGGIYIGDKAIYDLKTMVPNKDSIKKQYDFSDLYEYLKIKRNEIYARKGYIFTDKYLLYLFGQYDWYKPVNRVVKLNPIEKKNIDYILYLESNITEFEEYLSN